MRRPWAEREAAFAVLRAERPISHFDEPVIDNTAIEFPQGNGYYAITRHRDVATASRHPETYLSGPGAVSTMDLPSEMVEYFSGMISTDDPKHARLRRIVSNAFNLEPFERSRTPLSERPMRSLLARWRPAPAISSVMSPHPFHSRSSAT